MSTEEEKVLTTSPPPFTLNLAKRINQELIKRRLPIANNTTLLYTQQSTSREAIRKNPAVDTNSKRVMENAVAKKTSSLF